MTKIGDIIKEGEYKNPLTRQRQFKADCSPEHFKDLFIVSSELYMYGNSFIVDADNKNVINQLYYYLVGSPEFEGDLLKGIILMGAIGNGKTVILETFLDVIDDVANKIVLRLHSKDVSKVLQENVTGYLNKRPLFIDDMGKEQEAIKNYGTIEHPMEDLFSERYKNFALTFATSNYKFDDMKYSNHMKDRMKQMFNIIVLPGKSRRK